jgi:hypothetical protein
VGAPFPLIMNVSLPGQAAEFALALLLGAGLGFIYDCMRIVRGRLPLRGVTMALDGVFCLFCAAAAFWFAMGSGGGELRLSSIVAVTFGVILYFYLLSGFVRSVGFVLADGAIELFSVFSRPFISVIKIIHKIFTKGFSFMKKCHIIMAERKIRRKKAHGSRKKEGKKQEEIAGQTGDPHFRRMVGGHARQPSGADKPKKSRKRRYRSPARGAEDPQHDAGGGYRI